MFNFENIENITNKHQIQIADIKILSNNKVRLGEDARKKLGINENRNIIIQRLGSGEFICASTDKDSGNGRPVNKNGEFNHQVISTLLGGQFSEWAIEGEGVPHPQTGDIYFALKQTVNGEKERNKLDQKETVTQEENTVEESLEDLSSIENSTEEENTFSEEESVEETTEEEETEKGASWE